MINKTIKSCFLLFHLLVLSPAMSFGATDTWTCDAGDGKWSNIFNWDTGLPPTSASDVIITNACPSLVDEPFEVHNLTIEPGGRVEVPDGTALRINGDSIMDYGQLFLNGAFGSDAALYIVSAGVTLSGTGSLTMSDAFNNVITGTAGSGFINELSSSQGIQGAGRIGDGLLSLQNYGIINANAQGHTLYISPNATGTLNTGILTATGGGLLALSGSITNLEEAEIQANGGTVDLLGQVSGGTLSTSAGGIIGPGFLGNIKLDGVTLAEGCNYQIPLRAGTGLSGTITNNGTIQLVGGNDDQSEAAVLLVSTAVAVRGSGSITIRGRYDRIVGDGSLVNQQLIQGAGGIIIVASLNNQGTISALSSNFDLKIQIGSDWANSGLIQATSGAKVSLVGGVLTNDRGVISADNGLVTVDGQQMIVGGTLSTTSAGVVRLKSGTLDSSLLKGSARLFNGDDFTLKGRLDFDLGGQMSLNDVDCTTGCTTRTRLGIYGDVTLNPRNPSGISGPTGTITMSSNPNNIIEGVAGTEVLTNNITIQGAGNIGNGQMGLVNGPTGQINANSSSVPMTISMGPQNVFANNGLLSVAANSGSAPSLLAIIGPFANFDVTTGTLAGGSFNILGTLRFDNANVVNNAAIITLAGQIVDQNGANGLANFANNAGYFILLPLTFSPNFTSAGPFTNSGIFKVSRGSTFRVGGSGTDYDQTAGMSNIDGTLAVPTGGLINITGGTLAGTGTLSGKVSVGNSPDGGATDFIIGDSVTEAGKVSISDDYTQLPTSSLDVQIGGATAGAQYSQLNVTGTATVDGSLNIALINNFTPQIGQTFTILNASSGLAGTFSAVSGLSISQDEHFEVSYTSTGVVLTVQPGPAPAVARLRNNS